MSNDTLRRHKHAILHDSLPLRFDGSRNELIKRLLADACELCGAQGHCEVHHIRKLADLKVKGRTEKPPWVRRMAARQRKTLVVCRDCHHAITRTMRYDKAKHVEEPCAAKVACTVLKQRCEG